MTRTDSKTIPRPCDIRSPTAHGPATTAAARPGGTR